MIRLNSRILTILLMALSFYICKSQTCQPIAWYQLNGNATDQSGNSNHGTLHGTTPTTDRFGTPNSAVQFDGISDYISLSDDFDYAQRTISLWFEVDIFTTNSGMFYNSDHLGLLNGLTAISAAKVGGVNVFGYGNTGGGSAEYYPDTLLTNTWYHAAFVKDSTHLKFYFNGTLFSTLSYSTVLCSNTGDSLAHLGNSRNNDRFLDGSLDDVRIYNCSLTDAEIQQLYLTSDIEESNYLNQQVSIFPNPANKNLTIEAKQKSEIEIFNLQGQIIERLNTTENQTIIDVSDLPAGMYFIKTTTVKGIATMKFIKE